jgi:four helix bundle protein
MQPPLFDHERLEVYHASLDFIAWSEPVISGITPRPAAVDQIDRASTSVPLNIAEGNGKRSMPDRCRFFDIARGSAVECAACLDVLVAKSRISPEVAQTGKEKLVAVVNRLVRLIQSCTERGRSGNGWRCAEEAASYCVSAGHEPPEEKEPEQEKEQE